MSTRAYVRVFPDFVYCDVEGGCLEMKLTLFVMQLAIGSISQFSYSYCRTSIVDMNKSASQIRYTASYT